MHRFSKIIMYIILVQLFSNIQIKSTYHEPIIHKVCSCYKTIDSKNSFECKKKHFFCKECILTMLYKKNSNAGLSPVIEYQKIICPICPNNLKECENCHKSFKENEVLSYDSNSHYLCQTCISNYIIQQTNPSLLQKLPRVVIGFSIIANLICAYYFINN